MIHEILPVGMLGCNCSIFGDETTREAIVVDPGDDIQEIVKILERHALRVKEIVITHAHIDHIGGAAKLKALTGAPVLMNARDQELYDALPVQAQRVNSSAEANMDASLVKRDPEIMSGALCFSGTRVPVKNLFDYLEGSSSLEDFLEDFPSVTRARAVAVLEAARKRLAADASAA